MPFRANKSVAHLLLAVMLATFLSPSFGWHMHADHHEIDAHAEMPAPHEHDGDEHAGMDGHGGAHASIGHLLGHLTMHVPQIGVFLSPEIISIAPDVVVLVLPIVSDSSPPFRPPLSVRLA